MALSTEIVVVGLRDLSIAMDQPLLPPFAWTCAALLGRLVPKVNKQCFELKPQRGSPIGVCHVPYLGRDAVVVLDSERSLALIDIASGSILRTWKDDSGNRHSTYSMCLVTPTTLLIGGGGIYEFDLKTFSVAQGRLFESLSDATVHGMVRSPSAKPCFAGTLFNRKQAFLFDYPSNEPRLIQEVGAMPHGIAYIDAGTLAINHYGDGSVGLYNAETLAHLSTIPTSVSRSSSLDNHAHSLVFVQEDSSLWQVDYDRSEVRRIALTPDRTATNITVMSKKQCFGACRHADGRLLVVENAHDSKQMIIWE